MSRSPDRYHPALEAVLAQREPECSLTLESIRPAPYHFGAKIEPTAGGSYRQIYIGYDPRWPWQRRRFFREYCRQQSVDDPIETALHFILHHEVGHRHGCPGTPETGDRLHEAVWAVLAQQNKAEIAKYAVNLLADILVNRAVVEFGHAQPTGIVIDWHDQGDTVTNWRERITAALGRARRYQPHFSIFVQVQLALFGTEADKALLSRYLSLDAEVRLAAEALESLFRNRALTDDPQQWPALFAEGAKILTPFLPDTPPHPTSNPHPYFNPRSPDEATRRDSLTWFDEERNEVVPAPGAGNREAEWRALDWFYRNAARALPLQPRRLPRPPRATGLINLTPTSDALESIEHWPELHYIALALDTSNSMMEGSTTIAGVRVPWGSASRYHHALLALYRIVKWAETQPGVRGLNVLTFAEITQATGWFAPSEFSARAAPVIFPSQGGAGTRLNAFRLSQQIMARTGTLLFILTDGEITNGEEAIRTLALSRGNCMPILFLFGKENPVSQAMERAGFGVHLQATIEDFTELIVEEIEVRVPLT